jgi:hypothetical protein
MPPQQSDRLLRGFGEGFDFGAHDLLRVGAVHGP